MFRVVVLNYEPKIRSLVRFYKFSNSFYHFVSLPSFLYFLFTFNTVYAASHHRVMSLLLWRTFVTLFVLYGDAIKRCLVCIYNGRTYHCVHKSSAALKCFHVLSYLAKNDIRTLLTLWNLSIWRLSLHARYVNFSYNLCLDKIAKHTAVVAK